MGSRRLSALTPIAAALLYATALSAHAGTITVINTNDSGPGSLRQALTDASEGDTITFAVSGTIRLIRGELLVNKDVNISGPGTDNLAVSGNAKSRVFHISTGTTATISGLTIKNGVATGNYPDNSGGGIYNDHATLTVNDCAITGNFASVGGGINNDAFNPNHENVHAVLTINNSIFTENSVDGNGGAIYNYAYRSYANLTINKSAFTGNAAASFGGAVGNVTLDAPTSTMVSLNNSTLTGNTATEGGGILNYSVLNAPGTVEVNNSTLSGNSAEQGGGICNDSGDSGYVQVYVNSSTLTGNSGTDGGGISNFSDGGDAVLQISDSTLSSNSATTGGGIDNEGTSGLASLDISSSTLTGNWAVDFGGGIYNYQLFTPALNLLNTILNAGVSGENIYNVGNGRIISQGYNLSSDACGGYLTGPGDEINTDPLLGPLQDNGGPTFTHELLNGSPAINAGDPNFTPPPNYDQRGPGFNRVMNSRVDIGSFEVQERTPRQTPTPRPRPTPAPRPRPIPPRGILAPGVGESAKRRIGER